MTAPAIMLDTNIVSLAARQGRSGPLRQKLGAFEQGAICISVIAASEIRFGLERNPSAKARRNMELLLQSVPVLPFEPPADEFYARIRAHLASKGRPIGPNDLFIAAHAMALDLTLVTANIREFSRVPGLRVENWA